MNNNTIDNIDNKSSNLENDNAILLDKVKSLESQLNESIETKNIINDDLVKDSMKLGVEQGRKEYLESVQDKLDALDQLLKNILTEYKENLFNSSDDFIDIIFSSVIKIISKEYSQDIIFSMVNDVIHDLTSVNAIKIHVSADDIDYFDEYEFPSKSINVCVDSRVQHGGFIIESNNERLDCRLDKKIEIFKELLMDAKSHVD